MLINKATALNLTVGLWYASFNLRTLPFVCSTSRLESQTLCLFILMSIMSDLISITLLLQILLEFVIIIASFQITIRQNRILFL